MNQGDLELVAENGDGEPPEPTPEPAPAEPPALETKPKKKRGRPAKKVDNPEPPAQS